MISAQDATITPSRTHAQGGYARADSGTFQRRLKSLPRLDTSGQDITTAQYKSKFGDQHHTPVPAAPIVAPNPYRATYWDSVRQPTPAPELRPAPTPFDADVHFWTCWWVQLAENAERCGMSSQVYFDELQWQWEVQAEHDWLLEENRLERQAQQQAWLDRYLSRRTFAEGVRRELQRANGPDTLLTTWTYPISRADAGILGRKENIFFRREVGADGTVTYRWLPLS